MLHDMGPRDAGSTAVAGWQLGHRFGIIASTDHHGGYPGSHGDGRAAVIADRLTRDALWDAILARRTYAVTGDKIDVRMTLNDAPIGAEVRAPGQRRVQVDVRGLDAIDRVELLKNERVVARWHGEPPRSEAEVTQGRLRITWGWGRKDEPASWLARAQLDRGEIREVEPCFSGQSVVAPKGVAGHAADEDQADLPHAILERGERHVAWRSVTSGNLSTRHRTTQALSLLVDAPSDARLTIETEHGRWQHTLGELRHGGRSHYQQGWLSPALRIGPYVPIAQCDVVGEYQDEAELETDLYRLRVAQANGEWAWLSPIWVDA